MIKKNWESGQVFKVNPALPILTHTNDLSILNSLTYLHGPPISHIYEDYHDERDIQIYFFDPMLFTS